jgi:thioredoxin 1
MENSNVVILSTENFEKEVEKSEMPVLVDFWAPWCGPCRMITPIIEELSKEFGTQVRFAKCNVDDENAIAGKFKIMSIPTMILFKEGHPADKIIGARSKSELEEFINKYI